MDASTSSTTNWLEKLYSHDVYLIRRLEYFPSKFEFRIEFFNPENNNSTLSIMFTKVEAFEDVIHDLKEFNQSADDDQTDDPIDFQEHRKEGVTEYVLCTTLREIRWRTNEPPIVRGSKRHIDGALSRSRIPGRN
jgi:hypothetical protein